MSALPMSARPLFAPPVTRRLVAVWTMLLLVALVVAAPRAFAIDTDAMIERCRESVGKPIVQACVRAKVMRSGGSWQQYVEGCRPNAKDAVQACVGKLMSAAIARKGDLPLERRDVIADPGKRDIEAARTAVAAFVAPPRSVADITAILDQQKPNPTEVAKLTVQAEAVPPHDAKPNDLADFYYNRAQARATLGRGRDALADAELAVKFGQGDDYTNVVSRYEQFLMRRLWDLGEYRRTAEINTRQQAAFSKQSRGRLFGLNFMMMNSYLNAGDVDRAEQYAGRNRALLAEAKSWGTYPLYGTSFTAIVESGNARIAEARGRYGDAEEGYRKASQLFAETLRLLPQWPSAPPASEMERASDRDLAFEGRAKVRQGRVGEGEADIRRALLNQLAKNGKYHADTALVLGVLVFAVQEQGRYEDAEKLLRRMVDIYKGLGYSDDSVPLVNTQLFLAQVLGLEHNYADAAALYDRIDGWIARWDPALKENAGGGLSRVSVMLSQGKVSNAVEIAQKAFEREKARTGDNSATTAVARGFYAAALAGSGRQDEALTLFRATIPVLVAPWADSDDDSGATAAARQTRIRFVVESYFSLVTKNPAIAPPRIAEETFADADALRGQSVQRALQQSSVRSAASNPDLAALVRQVQDTDKQIGAAVGTLNNLLALSSAERDAAALKETQAQLAKLQELHAQLTKDIARKFPDYASLTKPQPPTPELVQARLADDEAMLSFYFGRFDSFVWVVRKGVPTRFVRLGLSLGDLNAEVTRLREALEPNAAMISDIPPFDLPRAFGLYQKLLKPVEEAWQPAHRLIVVTNGALGLLPLSLLPTAPSTIDPNDDPLFSSYRKVPWLARDHAVTLVPSASAFVTLRSLPSGKATRKALIAFGDPLFNAEQAAEAARETATASAGDAVLPGEVPTITRGAPLQRRSSPRLDTATTAQLAQLPRLPDTADELRAIALALHADPAEVLNLGKDANEARVKSIDLSGFKIVAFATHGLVPGELDGLSQPALALSAPSVAGVEGDGLLTMEDILTLRLDADWVLLSACNTGAGSGAGAEAASGLGRAFFYAGTRAILVTNWAVHSLSARQLIADLFRRQADDPAVPRGEALRQAMMALVDGPGYVGLSGRTQFAYAHPLFWAPYSIIGDGGRQ
ncbi:MAG: CHAT domain-containing protein [Xanthobacteraceae bacterium]|nr:CHAT domain-containing protein [Xanthobacteraceae bacterium]